MIPVMSMLLIGAAFVLTAVAVGVSAILREQRRQRHFRERMTLVSGAYARINPLAAEGRNATARSTVEEALIDTAARLFGFDRCSAEQSTLYCWLVVGTSLLIARLAAALLGIMLGRWSLLLVPIGWVMCSRFVFNWSKQRRRNALYAQFPDALAMVVRAVRVGIPLNEGIRTVAREATAPTGPEFAQLYDRVSIGVTLEDALREMAERTQLAEYRFFATALALQSRTGGGLAEALEGLADVMRRRLALKERGNALAAEAKTSIIILASLPFVSGGALAALNPACIGRLFEDPGCQKVLMAAIFLLGSGLLVMQGMIRKALS